MHIKKCILATALMACFAASAEAGALAEAAEAGDLDTVRSLLKSRPDVNEPGNDGTPALHWVVRMQATDLARQLLRAGAKADLANRYGVRPVHVAISNGDLTLVRLLLEAGADPNSTNSGDNCLVMATRVGNTQIVEALLAKGANADVADAAFGQTPLMAAAREGRPEIVRLLLSRGARVDAQTRTSKVPDFRLPGTNAGSKGQGIVRGGWPERGERDPIPGAKTPLLYAVREGHIEVVRLLVEAGAGIEKADADGVTPLLMSILNGQIPVALYLLEHGASVRASDWYGQTPLFAAVDLRNMDVSGPGRDNGVDRAAALQLVQAIIAKSPDINARTREYPPQRRWITRLGSLSWVDFTGQTAFLRAALAGDVTVMKLLLQHGADANIATFNGTTPLMAAAGVNWTVSQTFDEGTAALLEAAKLAQVQGNDVNAENAMGLRAIHGAANRGSNEIIQFLVEKGAALDTADREGRSPLIWAQGVFLATHPPQPKPATIALLTQLQARK
ncbi:MAG: ankyrin repeat domain-containing protein [Pseudomonadota bacterium]